MDKEAKREYDQKRYWSNPERERERSRRENRRASGQDTKAQDKRRIAKRVYATPAMRARRTLNRAVERGQVIRPNKCVRCGIQCKPHGHHSNYKKPLEVVWVCVLCHAAIHREERNLRLGQ